ncbi:MAG TPA: hypothetical protein VND64_00265 [Pirellulales bacterium]|nr:hypothetical protein [Pirellulales bacterium]
MNHGLVSYRPEVVASSIWDRAMSRGQFVAIYTERLVEGGGDWNSAFVHSIGEPAVLDPEGFGERPGFRHPTGEYARYNSQFCTMVEHSAKHAFLSVAVPSSAEDEEALRLLGEMSPAMFRLRERYWEQPHEKRTRRERRLRDVIGLIALRDEWAFFISSFDRYTPAAIVLADSESDVNGVAEAVISGGNRANVVEKW